MIQFNHLELGYQSTLLTVSVEELEAGRLYGLVGANGTGKSTFLKTIHGTLTPTKGTALVNGKDIHECLPRDRAKLVCYLPARLQNPEYLTGRQLVALGRTPYLTAQGRLTLHDHTIIEQAMETLNISQLADSSLNALSDGQQQLFQIASALAQETSIILLDEPTAFLDYLNRIKIIDLMKELAVTLNKTIVFSSHEIDLCIESKVPLLATHASKKILDKLPAHITKEEIVNQWFEK